MPRAKSIHDYPVRQKFVEKSIHHNRSNEVKLWGDDMINKNNQEGVSVVVECVTVETALCPFK